ncbi:MAG: FliI/YscN family ATPase [Myxococcales bacterium]|nr:FliI/YscN family ATPase [Myxococcales bacterium]USN49876.1 MAG: FliI/YscN family ATPase [Myxococcales bacterium]
MNCSHEKIKSLAKPFFFQNESLFSQRLNSTPLFCLHGRVLEFTSLVIRASVPLVSVGEMVHITRSNSKSLLPAQVVGFRENDVFLMPLDDTTGLSPNSQVIPSTKPFMLKVGYQLLGRVLNGLGNPIDNKGNVQDISLLQDWPLNRQAPDPYTRKPICEPLSLGVRAIDSLLTIGKGQRVGLFAGSGVGKSSLMGQIVRNTEAKIVIVCLVGERGREVMEFINDTLKDSLNKCIVIVATSDQPSLVRYLSCYVATAIAEWFRDQGEDVLFLMDSATRFARAQREIGLALGEPPARQGYPPSVFAEIPKLMERTGTNHIGSITALYTVLVQGSDFDEPIADEVRGILDGHIILNRSLAERGHWPAIDVLPSLSRVMNSIVDDRQKNAASRLRSLLSVYEKNKDLILLGAYKSGSDSEVDMAIRKLPQINSFLKQPISDFTDYHQTRNELLRLV